MLVNIKLMKAHMEARLMKKKKLKKSQGLETKIPSCETCKYKGFDVLFADSPCFGCVVTEGNFQSYEPVEED